MPLQTFQNLPVATRAYIGIIVPVGASTVLLSLWDLLQGQIEWHWLWVALLTLVSGSATVHLASVPVAISVSETFVFTSALLFGPSAGTLTVALDAAVISAWSYRKGQPLFKIVFNVCALPLTIWAAAHLFFAVSGIEPLFRTSAAVKIPSLVGPLVLFTLTYFSLSSWIVTFAISLEKGVRPFKVWRENFLWISLNYFGGASVALLLVSYTRDLDFTFLIVVVPLLAVLYATYAVTIGRFEDANRHLTELNSLYMATIETLAMAIDAKDQVTHGHIRRVQAYAIGLAKRLGVNDQSLIRAIEAAALLHDMGKLAVPEYILNKPGPLTPAEFDKMKLHASVGADILESINFPYPVVPIVRHHHENWDGSGYPDGLKSTEIPIGARILSVVDCFDALTSDRPYRPRLSDKEATQILLERRGTMYDPLIVDKFLDIYRELAPEEPRLPLTPRPALASIVAGAPALSEEPASTAGLEDITASTEEMLVLYDLARSLVGHLDLADATDIIAKHLRRIVPASACVFFLYDGDTDELVAAHACGDNASQFIGLRIANGERLSGWVAANQKTILNSDPVLDLGDAARSMRPRLKSCLSTPLTNNGKLVGVLSVYSTHTSAFNEDHRRLIEVIGKQISRLVGAASTREYRIISRDDLTGLPLSNNLEPFVASEIETRTPSEFLSIILISVGSSMGQQSESSALEQIVKCVAAATKTALRGADVLSRHGEREFVVLLAQTDTKAAMFVKARVVERLRDRCRHGTLGASTIFLGAATAPTDGVSLDRLVLVARERLHTVSLVLPGHAPSIH